MHKREGVGSLCGFPSKHRASGAHAHLRGELVMDPERGDFPMFWISLRSQVKHINSPFWKEGEPWEGIP